uniref:Uncharacterized protein n=1 Tax=Sphaerodactylus townsendi TaxID=933632 RepID=A0ACB8G6F8_9SAUR
MLVLFPLADHIQRLNAPQGLLLLTYSQGKRPVTWFQPSIRCDVGWVGQVTNNISHPDQEWFCQTQQPHPKWSLDGSTFAWPVLYAVRQDHPSVEKSLACSGHGDICLCSCSK